jgi:hypothetical protein
MSPAGADLPTIRSPRSGVAPFEGLYCAPSGLLWKGVTYPQGVALGFVMAALSGRPQGDGSRR